jgi:hypothetical protein
MRNCALESSDGKSEIVIRVGEEILAALTSIANGARSTLEGRSFGLSTDAVVNRSNMMVGVGNPERFVHAQNAGLREALRRLLLEPCIARVEVEWKNEARPKQTLYFARLSAAGLNDAVRGAHFTTSLDDLGHLAEHEAGETVTLYVRGRKRTAHILTRTVWSPREQSAGWDAQVDDFESAPWGALLALLKHDSLRQALELLREGDVAAEDILGRILQRAAEAQSDRQHSRRRAIDRIALRDRPILNKFQGAIFRLPLNSQVMLFGPPGSGKTTTLIRRLSQKRTFEALSDADKALVSRAGVDLASANSWAMFSPGELLKQYLGDAFNKQGVPDSGNVRTWTKERLDLARNVLNILRSATSGRFQLETGVNMLVDPSSTALSELHDELATFAAVGLNRRFEGALTSLLGCEDERAKRVATRIRAALGQGKEFRVDDMLAVVMQTTDLQDEVKRLGDLITAELRKINNLLLNRNKEMLGEIAALPSSRSSDQDDDDEDDDDETSQVLAVTSTSEARALNVLWNALRNWARAIAEGRRSLGGQSGRVIQLIGARLPPDEVFAGIGTNIAVRSWLRALLQVPRSLVLGVPAAYARFRRQMIREGRYYVADDAVGDATNRNMISTDELDAVLLVILRNARRVLRHVDARRDGAVRYDWLETIRSRYLTQVFVDEATDLSAVQLACTIELANPELRSWFACGDLRQRVTATGIRSEAEIEWLNRTTGVRVDIQKIDIGYRQSRKLREFSDALAALLDRDAQKTRPPLEAEEADAWPLLAEGISGAALGTWLADRIQEVEEAIGGLPSIAVFVDGDVMIDPLVNATRAALAEWNISIVGCKEGRVVGDTNEVRVFDIHHIKGLEFEAVFFIGIDGLARRLQDLFQRYLYVGVTRAATYLGLTCEERLPELLEPLRPHFGDRTDWQPG